ncbi:short-chain dehydrogenase/reductase [Streptomyces fulvorobeus]|uniref:NAD(P)-dependent dehydrogenase (Short-subunit alcohol dehydrogenase family) n=1 Tax=Streptomyces fulvorobeus TaxID=284028 RepID=A0A7J0C001_9ACTN|nr:short-chain dehydrogenase/reductase [Streptomyces fulvorobeus]NYE39512.1 NAD(P)-dependent dehydrogenase (short-subunit alcohol dehydrogenase family) [Streptomyces fulvorobeus]GFM95748.1 short-chain dehydrogenase [Streptomyces fulvorobeus]
MTAGQHVLRGRTAVVTGAARGVGAAVATALAARGARVALLGLEEESLAAVAAALPAPALYRHVDVTDDAAMADAAEEVRRTLGDASVVVANAGVAEGGPFLESDPVTWRRVIEVNLVGSAVTARSFLPQLLRTRGYYLQIASLASIGAAPMMSAYCASKAGVESFAQSLRAEVESRGIGVGTGYLNWTDTDMIRDADQHAVLRELRAHMPPPARKIYPAGYVAEALVRAVERRSATVYVPRWLRAVQVVRAALPGVVVRYSRQELTRSEFSPTGLLGAGGRAAAEDL